MASVCKWLSFYLCLRDSPKFIKDTKATNAELHMYDAIIVWKGTKIESPKETKAGVAYDVILAPASTEGTPKPSSPPKERPLSQEIIEKKLKDAEERRLSQEAAKLQPIAKQKERAHDAVKRVEELNSSFSKETEKKLSERLECMEENKDRQIKALQDRLKDHAKRVEAARKQSELYSAQMKERMTKRLSTMKVNREAVFTAMQERLQEHEKHVQEVVESCNKLKEQVSKCTEEKMIKRMNVTLQNREEQLKQILARLQEHERHVEEVRNKKEVLAAGDSAEASS